jgi:predicted Zn-dependent protease
MNKPEEAATALESALGAHLGNAAMEGNLGSIYLKLNRIDDAEKHLQEAIRLDPNFSDAYYALAQVWESRGDHAIARMYLNRAHR